MMRPDNRLSDAPMAPVACRQCGASVLVRKSSWEQTSVQWSAAAMARCEERRAPRDTPSVDGAALREGTFLRCESLRASIEAAVAEGALAVFDES